MKKLIWLLPIVALIGIIYGCSQVTVTSTTTTASGGSTTTTASGSSTTTTSGGGGTTTTTPTTTVTATTNGSGRHGLTHLFFLHHSIGGNLIDRGSVRATISSYASGFDFWDQGYRQGGGQDPWGLRNTAGTLQSTDYYDGETSDGTDPADLANLFSTTSNVVRDRILANQQVIAFKSCYTAVENLSDDATLTQYENYYLSMRNLFDSRTDNLFVVVTDPPLHPSAPNAHSNGVRGRAFANWLKSTAAGGFLAGSHPNIVVFDFFDYLADSNDTLKAAYAEGGGSTDSHPTEAADQYIGPIFARFLVDSARNY